MEETKISWNKAITISNGEAQIEVESFTDAIRFTIKIKDVENEWLLELNQEELKMFIDLISE